MFNNSSVNTTVKFTIKSSEPEEVSDWVNCWFPESQIEVYVKANSQQTVAYFIKLHPKWPFGSYRIDFTSTADIVEQI